MSRSVQRIVNSTRTTEGAGFQVRRPFPTHELDSFDPFLLIDEMGPMDLAPGQAKGAPDHPHRGFETVTYMLAGEMEHEDSAGHRGRLTPGDVQWMTAGAGIVHSEMPSPRLLEKGGRMHGFQVWVNLPKRDKMMRPRYQELPNARVPEATSPDGKVWAKVLAGEAFSVRAAIETRTPIVYIHFRLQPGASFRQPVAASYNALAYFFSGRGAAGDEALEVEEGDAVLFAQDGEEVFLQNTSTKPTEILLLAGEPLDEPVARHGPFVMNTKAEVVQAFEDFHSGKFGEITRSAQTL